MRVSGGELRSRRIHVPSGRAIRPTPGRVKEALFSILGTRVSGGRVLDLYAGTGAIGFEALSRGAAHVTFVESHGRSAARIRAAAAELGVAERVVVVAGDARRAVRSLAGPFDLVYADPPFAEAQPSEVFGDLRLRGALAPTALIVFEHRAAEQSEPPAGFRLLRAARYGEVALDFLAADA